MPFGEFCLLNRFKCIHSQAARSTVLQCPRVCRHSRSVLIKNVDSVAVFDAKLSAICLQLASALDGEPVRAVTERIDVNMAKWPNGVLVNVCPPRD